MKTIYLQNSNYEWCKYEVESNEDLKKIIAEIGSSYAEIGSGTEIGTDALDELSKRLG